jgi:RimJ/RimL family protein N-acetyltransferase
MIPSTTLDGKTSRIRPILESMAVVIPRGDVHYVATEYGLVNLFGKSLEERALAMISIAHPDFRDRLLERAKDFGLLSRKRAAHEIACGVYPVHLEETRTYDGVEVLFRPAKPVDTRQIQEHFYHLEEQDVVKRFFQKKTRFVRDEVADFCEVDYVHDLSMVAVVGEAGYEEVIAVGTYYLNPSTNLAETAFSVTKEWQGKGLSSLILAKLALNARDHGIAGLYALVSPTNLGMIRLFQKLPFKLKSRLEEDQLAMTVRFNQPLQSQEGGIAT